MKANHATKCTKKLMDYQRFWPIILLTVTFILGFGTPQAWAFGRYCVDELDEAKVFIEWNSTDSDRGIQFFWDGEPWKWMVVKNQNNRSVLNVIAQRNVRAQGLTEGFFESAEPVEDVLPTDAFFARFPEGEYSFVGRSQEGCWLTADADLTHDLPEPVELNLDGFPSIAWDASDGGPEVIGYEVVVELVVLDGEDEFVYVDTATFPGNVTTYSVSPEFLLLIEEAEANDTLDELKVEVIALEESGNKTITEQEVD